MFQPELLVWNYFVMYLSSSSHQWKETQVIDIALSFNNNIFSFFSIFFAFITERYRYRINF